MREPPAALRFCKQFVQRGVEFRRLFAGNRVAGARHDNEARGRHGAAQIDAGIDAPFVLVADDDEQRRLEGLEAAFHLLKRRTLGLQIFHHQRMADIGMLAHQLDEMRVAARILVLLRLPGRTVAIFLGGLRHRVSAKHLAVVA